MNANINPKNISLKSENEKDDLLLTLEVVNAEDVYGGGDGDFNAIFDVIGAAETYSRALKNVENAFENPLVLETIRTLIDLPTQ